MKKGIIAISLLLSGALLITPITNASAEKQESEPVKAEQVDTTENLKVSNESNDKTIQTEEVKAPVKEEQSVTQKEELVKKEETTKPSTEDVITEDKEDVAVETGMSKSAAESVLNKYLTDVEKVDFTYVYQGDENTFEAMQQKGIRGYVFLPNVETDMAYLVDKDNGSIYFFHPSGYFEQLQ